ncbi:MAG TPA: hypothetical protein VH877_31180 [Polyangia bacterium]|jgi:hypothetical protein|nr:hypothetical protein [Polyangia bacterium]
MYEFVREAGWPIYPIMAFGISALILSLRHARAPERRLMPLITGLCVATIIMGVLGTVLGVQHCIRGVASGVPEERWIVFALLGLREALNCFVGAMMLVLPTTLAAMLGAYRLHQRDDLPPASPLV